MSELEYRTGLPDPSGNVGGRGVQRLPTGWTLPAVIAVARFAVTPLLVMWRDARRAALPRWSGITGRDLDRSFTRLPDAYA